MARDKTQEVKNAALWLKLWSSVSGIYSVYVENFMVRDVKFIWRGMKYRDLKDVLKENKHLRSFPLVDKPGKKLPIELTPNRLAMPLANRKIYFRNLFRSALSQFQKYYPSWNLKFNKLGIFQILKLRIWMGKNPSNFF